MKKVLQPRPQVRHNPVCTVFFAYRLNAGFLMTRLKHSSVNGRLPKAGLSDFS